MTSEHLSMTVGGITPAFGEVRFHPPCHGEVVFTLRVTVRWFLRGYAKTLEP